MNVTSGREHVLRKVAATLIGLVSGLTVSCASFAQAPEQPPPGEYRIVDGRVDSGTHTGWRLFHSACHGCHGVDATGTDLAPNLVEAVAHLTPRTFTIKVLTSYRLFARSGQSATEQHSSLREAQLEEILRRKRSQRSAIKMPAWGIDQKIKPHVLDLFAYLTARAQGGLESGEPNVIGGKAGGTK